jgi:hypothetical protein
MTNDIAKMTGSTELSTDMLKGLVEGIQESNSTTILAGGGMPILRLLKSGVFVYGQNADEVQEGSEWAINPLSIMHGWGCWSDNPGNQKNTLLGEIMVPVNQKKPLKPEPINGFEYKEQRFMNLMCVTGNDEGTEVVWKIGSLGGMRAYSNFSAAFTAQLRKDPKHPVAIVQLLVDDYPHPKWGQTFVPVIEIVDWASLDGTRQNGASVNDPTPQPQPVAQPLRPGAAPRRQRPAVVR